MHIKNNNQKQNKKKKKYILHTYIYGKITDKNIRKPFIKSRTNVQNATKNRFIPKPDFKRKKRQTAIKKKAILPSNPSQIL